MKIYLIAIVFVLSYSKVFSQSMVKTYYDPFTRTQLKEVYYVIPNTPVPNGLYKLYDEDRALSEIGNYIRGKKVGIWKEYFGGVLSHVATYKNGKPDGMQTFYNHVSDRNRVLRLALFKDGVPIKVTDFVWFDSGIKAAEHSIQVDHVGAEDGPSENVSDYNGLTIIYWEIGGIKTKGNYNNGVRVGTWEEFRDNGLRNNVYVYNSEGRPINYTEYCLNGKLKLVQNVDKPNIVIQIDFDSLKSIKKTQTIIEYTNSDLQSISNKKVSYFDSTGKSIQVTKTYSATGREGTWKEYLDKDFKEVYDTTKAAFFRIITYKSDQIIGKAMGYYINGAPQSVFELESDIPRDKYKPNSNFIIYYPNGKTQESGTFDNLGLINSDFTYNNDGKLTKSLEKKSVERSITNFLITWYDSNGNPLRTKEIKISSGEVSEAYKNLFEEYSK